MSFRDEQRSVALGSKGFLKDPTHWDTHFATWMANELGIDELSVPHWRVVEYLRSGWLSARILPVPRHLCRELDLAADCLDKLFGGLIEAWKVAGLPDPGEEARVYMENMETADTITK